MTEQVQKEKKGLSFLWGAVTGAVVGAVSALLFAPKKGTELRADIKEGTSKVIEVSSQTLQTVAEKTTEVVKVVEEKAAGVVEDTRQAFQKLVNRSQETAGEVIEESIEEVKLVEALDATVEQTGQEDTNQSIN